MNFFFNISKNIFPLFLILVFCFSAFTKNDIIKSFKAGAKNGVETIYEIMPNIILITVATSLFRNLGALNFTVNIISPFLNILKIPKGLCELILMRPISGSGSISLLTNIYNKLGPDSYEGLIASLIASSTETTIYTVSIYFGVTKVKNTSVPLFCGLLADMFVIAFSIYIINLFFV